MSHTSTDEVSASAIPFPKASVSWYATIMLALLYWLSVLDRFIISLLVDPIRRDLGLTDVQFGILHGAAFALTFSVLGLLAGAAADRFNRRWVIFAGVALWSMATAACGMAQNFWHMLLARVGVGAGEAGLNPCATSMISDLFLRARLTTAMAVYAVGSTLGSGSAYLFGGLIVALVAQSQVTVLPLIGEVRSWQAVFFIVGIPGMFMSLLIFTVPEPVRRGLRSSRHSEPFLIGAVKGYAALLRFMATRKRFFALHYAGFAFASMVVAGAGTWYPAYLGRAFGWNASKIGLGLGLALVISGIVGKLVCGTVVDWMYRKGRRDAQLRWYAGCLALATPIGIFAVTGNSHWIFLIGICLFSTLLSALPACASASLNLATPNELRGTGIAFFASTSGLVGTGLGSVLIASVSETFFGGGASIGLGIAVAMAVCCPAAAILLYLGMRPMRAAVEEADRWEAA